MKILVDSKTKETVKSKKHWQIHQDLIIFRNKFFLSNSFTELEKIATQNKCSRIAVLDIIQNDDFRTPRIVIVKGSSGWIIHKDNKISYAFDITKCMFSFGNITEKLRISKIDCEGEIIVDLFCGIGYFTLPFLVHAKASKVFACDWNPHAIEALKYNLELNKVQDRCQVHLGNCNDVAPVDIADRVYLGLIPSSKIGWPAACRALNHQSGGILHVHENVESFSDKHKLKKQEVWVSHAEKIIHSIKGILAEIHENPWTVSLIEINKIKSYAPHIDHLVFDIKCMPIV